MKQSEAHTAQASGLFHRAAEVAVRPIRSWPLPILTLAVMLLAVATFLGVFAGARAQQADGAISGLTLTSDAPGTLHVSWDAPGAVPTDYRVNWARSDETFPSWTDDTANRYPQTTSLQLTGLDQGAEYKVRVRARFYDGTHADSPWSGAWAEATLLVAAPVAAQAQQYDGAISGLTLTSDAPGDLDLSWDAPGTAPTDYWVSWARSGEDWPAETDAAANRYPTTTSLELTGLDEGTEYQVRVRARYTDGAHADSPWSGAWAEATLLVAAPVAAQAQQYDGAISGLTLTSDAPGDLDLSWDAPGTAPTDYWVSWARSGEDWPAETDAAANRYPTTTSLELTGLDEGTEYQVRVRARYTDGTHADSPWSGAWAEATLLVAATVAAQAQQYDGAISGLTLTSDAPGDLDLSWDAPGTAPTDYWVSWARSGEDWPAETDAAPTATRPRRRWS